MKISFNWLKNYIQTGLDAQETARILTDIGLEVESVEQVEPIRGGLEGVVVGHVLTCERHPDADRLSVTTVDVGGQEPLQIVCGAPNVAAGQNVPVAMVNATLYPAGEEEGFKIKKSKIRGVESLGMICAEDELGLGSGHDGIIVLPDDLTPGMALREYYNLTDDYIFEIGLTPNRADAMSHYGVARDLAVYLRAQGQPVELSLPDVGEFKPDTQNGGINVEVVDHDGAPRYMGLTINGVKVGPSPEWLQQRLRAIGMTPRNNVVDITNFVLHEAAQPLHAFDAGKVRGGRIVVRTYPEGTRFTTLDGVERTLSGDDLMICDTERPLCIAGVFGGLDAGVTEETTSVFLESAYFNPRRIRKSARRHGLNTDASFRFERGIDPDIAPYGLKRAALLIKELAGGEISPATDIYPEPVAPFRFEVSYARINRLIGKEIPVGTIRGIIEALDVKIEKEKDGVLQVAVPPYRVDVRREADLVEDILRIYGYNNVEIPQSVRSTLAYAPDPDRDKLVNRVADLLAANGFHEIMSNSLTKIAYYEGLESYPLRNGVRLLNPLSNDLGVMRQTLLFNMLEAVELNANHRNPDLKLFEFGNVYFYDPEKTQEGGLAPYREEYHLAMAVTGTDHVASWNQTSEFTNFFTLKAYAEKILRRFGLDPDAMAMEPMDMELYSEGVSWSVKNKPVMGLGIVAPKFRKQFDLRNEVYYLEMNFDALVRATRNHRVAVRELPKYPEVRRDLALLVDTGVTYAQLHEVAFSAERKFLKRVALFDVYEGDKVPAGKKSYALTFVLQDPEKTLVDQAIDRMMNNLVGAFESKLGARIRS